MNMSPIVMQQPPAVRSELPQSSGLHVAIISDGNGRWATSRGLPRSAGRRADRPPHH
jgi:undecaprenyl diphosphate synthase